MVKRKKGKAVKVSSKKSTREQIALEIEARADELHDWAIKLDRSDTGSGMRGHTPAASDFYAQERECRKVADMVRRGR